jgi:Flp pilus assembly pilin Flp
MTKFLSNLWNDESGISSVEYALLLSFVAAGIIIAASELAVAVSNEMIDAASCISTTTPSAGC